MPTSARLNTGHQPRSMKSTTARRRRTSRRSPPRRRGPSRGRGGPRGSGIARRRTMQDHRGDERRAPEQDQPGASARVAVGGVPVRDVPESKQWSAGDAPLAQGGGNDPLAPLIEEQDQPAAGGGLDTEGPPARSRPKPRHFPPSKTSPEKGTAPSSRASYPRLTGRVKRFALSVTLARARARRRSEATSPQPRAIKNPSGRRPKGVTLGSERFSTARSGLRGST